MGCSQSFQARERPPGDAQTEETIALVAEITRLRERLEKLESEKVSQPLVAQPTTAAESPPMPIDASIASDVDPEATKSRRSHLDDHDTGGVEQYKSLLTTEQKAQLTNRSQLTNRGQLTNRDQLTNRGQPADPSRGRQNGGKKRGSIDAPPPNRPGSNDGYSRIRAVRTQGERPDLPQPQAQGGVECAPAKPLAASHSLPDSGSYTSSKEASQSLAVRSEPPPPSELAPSKQLIPAASSAPAAAPVPSNGEDPSVITQLSTRLRAVSQRISSFFGHDNDDDAPSPVPVPGRLFLSYRVSADSDLLERVYDKLRALDIDVWWDRQCLKPGQPWEEGFADGLLSSDVFVPFLSRAALAPFGSLQADSRCDNVLLEYRVALELKERGLLRAVFPVFVGDEVSSAELGEGYGDFFACGSMPAAPDVSVGAVEAKLREHLRRAGKGSGGCVAEADRTVSRTLKAICAHQGEFLKGSPKRDALERVVRALAGLGVITPPGHGPAADRATPAEAAAEAESAAPCASIPPEVPQLPATLQARPALLSELKKKVLTGQTTSLVGVRRAAATTTAHGMGGVGKTTVAVQLIRDPEVGTAFQKLLWVSISADPDMLHLMRILYYQLTDTQLPAKVQADRDAAQELTRAATGVRALLVLDDCWDAKHAERFNVVDAEVGSACIITTRIRNLGTDELSCGLLTVEESLALLLSSAGLHHLISHPPQAAYEAVERCGRLALALPIAGGMIRQLDDVWERDLNLMLQDELSEEVSVEKRIVDASLRCVEASQRAGVEALFACFGCFAEDAVVPAAALDVLARIVCGRAGADTKARPHLKVRKWLASLLKASLLIKHGDEKGVSAHDLVRETMITRLEAAAGGMVALQRDVLRLFLTEYDANDSTEALRAFIIHSLRHHIAHAQQAGVSIHKDALLLSALTNGATQLSASAVLGIGMGRLVAEIEECEASGRWWEAAQLLYAIATYRGSKAGAELKRSWAALKQIQPETELSVALEARVLGQLMYALEGSYAFGSAEHTELQERMKVLRRTGAPAGLAVFDAKVGELLTIIFQYITTMGVAAYCPQLTPQILQQCNEELLAVHVVHQQALVAAPDLPGLDLLGNLLSIWVIDFCMVHLLPHFDMEAHIGRDGALCRENIERYEFAAVHKAHKTGQNGIAIDFFLYGDNPCGVLLFYGDMACAKRGWAKEVDAWRQIELLCASGEAAWGEYMYEDVCGVNGCGLMLTAGEPGLVQEFVSHTFFSNAIRAPEVMEEMIKAVDVYPFLWAADDGSGRCYSGKATFVLRTRALAAVSKALIGGPIDADAVRAWLPPVAELIRIAETEDFYQRQMSGLAHPTMICAAAYAHCLGAWAQAAAVCEGVLAITVYGAVQPLVRIEAWRLLARCKGEAGEAHTACEACESAAREAAAVRYVFMVARSLRDMIDHRWVEGEAAAEVWARIDEVEAKYVVL